MADSSKTREAVTWTQPSHPNLIKVNKISIGGDGKDDFNTTATSLVTLSPNAHFCDITNVTRATQRTYATVQGFDGDIDLNSDLVFCNHACSNPTLVFDMLKMEVRVGPNGIKEGEELTFFYPSTEWEMAGPFQCTCGSEECVGMVKGAKYLGREVLGKYWLNEHIVELLARNKKMSMASGE